MICIPIRKKQFKSLLAEFKKAQKHADIIEIWFDEANLSHENLEALFKLKRKPILYKCQDPENLEKMKNYNIDYTDLDLKTPKKYFKQIPKNSKLIISFHDFEKTPKNLKKLAEKLLKNKPHIIKMATHAKTFSDSLRMLKLLNDLNEKSIKAICICMGKHGRITRLTGHLLGNYLMFAPLKSAGKTAPGQITAEELTKIQCLSK